MLRSKKDILFSLTTISLFLLLLNTATIYANYFKSISYICLGLSGVISIVAIFIKGSISLKKYVIYYLIILMTVFFINGIVSGFSIEILNYFLKFVIAYLIVDICYYLEDSFFKILYIVSAILIVWALILYIITLLNINLSFLPVTDVYTTWWGQKRPLYAFVIMQLHQDMEFVGIGLNKLSYPLLEAGIAEIYANYCIFYLLFLTDKMKFKKLWVTFFIICSFLTLSLVGIATLFLIIALYFIKTKRFISVLFFVLVAVWVCSYFILEKIGTSSYNDRTNDYSFIFQTIKENFPLGIGLGNMENTHRDYFINNQQTKSSFFSGLFSPLVYIGAFSLIYYIGLIKAFINSIREKGIVCRLSLAVIVILSLLTQPIAFTSIINVIIINGLYANRNSKSYYLNKSGTNTIIQDHGSEE